MGEDDLLTCRNQQNKTRHSPCTDEALMKQFNLFLAARGIVNIKKCVLSYYNPYCISIYYIPSYIAYNVSSDQTLNAAIISVSYFQVQQLHKFTKFYFSYYDFF